MHRMVGVLAVLLAIYSGVMWKSIQKFPKRDGGCKVDNPGIILQLASSDAELRDLLGVGPDAKSVAKDVLLAQTHLDNFFIPTYAAFFLAFIWMMGRGGTQAMHRLALAACLTIAVAAVADGFENYHIFAALGLTNLPDGAAVAIRNPSHIKWFFTNVTLALIAILLFQERPWPFGKFNPVLAGVAGLASAVGFCGFVDRALFGLALSMSSPIGLACISLLWLKKQKES